MSLFRLVNFMNMHLIVCCNTVCVSKYMYFLLSRNYCNVVARDIKLYAFTRMSSNKYAMLLRVIQPYTKCVLCDSVFSLLSYTNLTYCCFCCGIKIHLWFV